MRVTFILVVSGFAAVALGIGAGGAAAQQKPQHLSPVIEKLAQGRPVFGISTTDLSLDNASALARSDLDYVRVEMEHTPLSFETLRAFLLGTIDRAAIVKKGNAQQQFTSIIRLPPYGREQSQWMAKQVLDLGMMGIIFSTIETKEEALSAVRSMRYPQLRGAKYPEPVGLRGIGPTNAVWFWGVPNAEYMEHADLWPLNPAGDLLAIMLIESVKGVQNVDEIAAVPGVGGLYAGTGDLSRSMGVSGAEVEAAVQKILKACLAHNVACKINASANDVQRRIKEGWKILNVGALAGGLTTPIDAALRAGRAATK
jgi:4-hydroxy-2-oxoheptanedioate aldolase